MESVSAETETEPEPESVAPELVATVEPEPEPEPAPVAPEPEPDLETVSAETETEPELEPETAVAPELVATVETEPEPVPTALESELEPEPEPVVAPELIATVEPELVPLPEPEPEVTVEPEPEATPEPVESEALAGVEPEPVAASAPEPEPEPEPAVESAPPAVPAHARPSGRSAEVVVLTQPTVRAPPPPPEPGRSAAIFRSMRAKAMALAAENEARAEAIAAPLPFQPAALREPVSPETLPAALLENSPSAAVALAPATDPAPGAVADRPPAAAAAQLTLVADALDQAVKTLTDTVTIFASSSMPQERALAADALALLLPHLHDLAVEQVARRVSAMAAPPAGLLSLLLEHPNPRAAELVVERSPAVSEHDLTRLIDRGSETAMLAMARRRQVSELVAEQLAKTRSGPVLLALARNSGASLSPHTFEILCDMAAEFPALQAPLATRPNLPPAQAFELFWHSPPDLRRHLLTRFLVDTEAVGKIVRSIEAVGLLNRGAAEAGEVDTFVELLAAGQITFAVQSLSSLLAIDPGTAERIVTDRSGEALAAALKALGMTRADASKTIELLVKAEHAPITSDRNTQELHYVFDSLSMNKARVLLTYWDWSVRRRKGH